MPSPIGGHLAVKEQKLVVVGGGGVGKSAVTIRFVTSQFYDQGYNPTIEDSYRKQTVVDDEAVQLEILDTAGQEEYAAMKDQWYKFGTGFLLVYSITDRPTFEAISGFHQDILRVKDRPYVPCVVASNKCDLGHLRTVGQLEGRDLAKSLSAPFIECSAMDGVNVDIAFRELVKLVRKTERVSILSPTVEHSVTVYTSMMTLISSDHELMSQRFAPAAQNIMTAPFGSPHASSSPPQTLSAPLHQGPPTMRSHYTPSKAGCCILM